MLRAARPEAGALVPVVVDVVAASRSAIEVALPNGVCALHERGGCDRAGAWLVMLTPTGWWLAVAPVDLRCGVARLLVKVHTELGRRTGDGGAYVFRNRASTRIKVLCVDATGVWLCVRRLHRGGFTWPRLGEGVCALSPEQFAWLCAGVDWQRLSMRIEGLPKSV